MAWSKSTTRPGMTKLGILITGVRMSTANRHGIAVLTVVIGLAIGRLFASESQRFESGETQTTLLELFTSEGCSSCPPAEKWLTGLKSNQELWKKIVPIAFHVNYWDHLGWRDRFAKPEFTSRQQHYAATWGADSVYTPAFVVNGKEWRDWFGGNLAPATSSKVGVFRLSLDTDGTVNASFTPEKRQPRALTLNIALLGNDIESNVRRGENTGRKLRHDFVVLHLTRVDLTNESNTWHGSVLLPMHSGDDRPSALAAWIAENETFLQATGGWLR
jgi:hypothetical protein